MFPRDDGERSTGSDDSDGSRDATRPPGAPADGNAGLPDVETTTRRSTLRALGAGGLLPFLSVGDAATDENAPPTVAWSRSFDADGGSETFAALARTPDCGFVLAGTTDPVGAERADGWLVKATETGVREWARAVDAGDHVESRFTDVVTLPDVGYGVVGYQTEFAPPDAPEYGERYPTVGRYLRTDFAGNVETGETYGSPTDSAVDLVFESLVRAPDGSLTMAGGVDDFLESEYSRGWLQTTTPSGERQGVEQYTPATGGWWNEFNSHVRMADGGYALAGRTRSRVDGAWLVRTDADGDVRWERTFGTEGSHSFADLVRTADGGYVLAGTADPPDGDSRGWLVAVDANGGLRWERTFAADGGSFAALTRTDDGGYVIVGAADDGVGDGWVVKTDADGRREWDRRLGGACEFGRLNDVLRTGDGGFVTAGERANRSDGRDGWLVKLA